MERISLASGRFIEHKDPNERKEMRRKRIKRRLEEVERKKRGASDLGQPHTQTFIDRAIETSGDVLRQLYFEGKEQVSNILIARDKIEIERRKEEAEERELRVKNLEKDSAEAREKLDVISKKWEQLLETRDPLELSQLMNEQKQQCLDLISQKNKLIKEFQFDLRIADEKYMKNKKEMHKELALLTQRIDDQTLVMKKAYRAELEKNQVSIREAVSEVVKRKSKDWQMLYKQREKDETLSMDLKINMAYELQEDLRRLYNEHEEQQRETNIQVDSDIQVLELELQQIKALCLLNSEKLDYNYQVLKKREEENIYIKNHQRRRLNKLQDIVNKMKKKFENKKEASAEELQSLLKEIKRCHICVVDTEKKAEDFSKLNDEKFNKMWDMKEEEARDLVEKIRIADRIIYEQIIGKFWKPPAILTVHKTDMPSYKTAALTVVQELKVFGSDSTSSITKDFKEDDSSPENVEGHHRLLQHILKLISDHAGFLIDQKLKTLLEPYSKSEESFVRLDRVFSAIGVHSEQDIKTLKKAFYPYVFCLACDKKESKRSSDLRTELGRTELGSHRRKTSSVLSFQERFRDRDQDQEKVVKIPIKYDVESSDEDDTVSTDRDFSESFSDKVPDAVNLPSLKSIKSKEQEVQVTKCNITHPLIIEKHNVLKGLKDFVINFHSEKFKMSTALESRLDKKRFTISRLLSKNDIIIHWEKYKDLLPPRIDFVWNIVLLGLTKYLKLLRERHEINLKAQTLTKQNQELKRLLSLHREKFPTFKTHLPGIASAPDKPFDRKQILNLANKLSL